MTTKRAKKPPKRKPKVVRLKIPIEHLKPILNVTEDELAAALMAERVDLVLVDDAGRVAEVPIPRSVYRRLVDYFTR